MPTRSFAPALFVLLLSAPAARAAPPVVLDPRLTLELVAREPEIVTPTGLAVDERGRVWVIENNTHQRGPKYKGPATDRVRVLEDLDGSGRARRATTFAEGFKNAMSLAFGPDGALYLATRSELFLLQRAGLALAGRKSLVKLHTKGNYPHNGLSGFAFDGLGNLVFGMGENLGAAYKLVGSDGTTLAGGGEGGNLFTCRPDGTQLRRIATGFWNPFGHTFDAFGRLFAVDNDPDARGPCRLLHAVEGGDFGYRFRYGRRGTHPFQSWDGELPGTLGMVSGTGEAPCGVLAYESAGLPAEYRGCLLVTAWGDHRIERYDLAPRGASFSARLRAVVRGGDDFRPVGLAAGPDGAVYFSDWVDRSYPVHGKGRVWRLRAKTPAKPDGLRPSQVAGLPTARVVALLDHPRQDVRHAATAALAARGKEARAWLPQVLGGKVSTRARLHALWAAARMQDAGLVGLGLAAPEPEARAEAVRLLPVRGRADEDRLAALLNKDASAAVRLQAILRLGGPATAKAVVPFLGDADPFLLSAAVTALGRPGNVDLLLTHAGDGQAKLRLGVLLALRRGGEKRGRSALGKFLADADPDVRRSAIQWVGEERLAGWSGQLESAAGKAPTGAGLLRALLAARHLLAGGKADADPSDAKLLARMLHQPDQPPAFRVIALQMLPARHPAVAPARLAGLLHDKDPALRRQAARTLALHGRKGADEVLLGMAGDDRAETALRAEAVLGLAPFAATPAVRRRLLGLLDNPGLRRDALRSLRGAAGDTETAGSLAAWWGKARLSAAERPELAGQMLLALKGSTAGELRQRLGKQAEARPATAAGWQKLLGKGGDPAAGERVFFHPSGPGCYRCHRKDGNGEAVGPDLSSIGSAMSRERIVESILMPSKEIAPRYVSWRVVTLDGKVRAGVIADEDANSVMTLADAEGKLHRIRLQDVEERTALATSIMPEKLHELMTPGEFRDLVAYLAAPKGR
jgi:putative membrane-bound dehydrogenase-like protein